MCSRIALVKIGWSDDYQGGPVLGRHSYLNEYNDGHERYNFLQCTDGRYYGYIPPIGGQESPPRPKVKDGWLLVFVSARNGEGALTVVGWYQNAQFSDGYRPRPEYADKGDFETDIQGQQYTYCFSSESAHLISTTNRIHIVSGKHFRKVSIIYLRGNGQHDNWRRRLAQYIEKMVTNHAVNEPTRPYLNFPDAKHRRKVECASIKEAEIYLIDNGYKIVKDRQADKCGYDLLVKHYKTREELHVEVKGTSGASMHFYMSRNEHRYMDNPKWRLIIVTDALSVPKAQMFRARDARLEFNFDAFAWEATGKVR